MNDLNGDLILIKYNKYLNLVVVFIILLLIVYTLSQESIDELNYEYELNSEYSGVVLKKNIDTSDHSICKLTLDSKKIVSVWNNCYEKVSIGDSIVKKKGDLKFIIYKKNEILLINIDDNLIIPSSSKSRDFED